MSAPAPRAPAQFLDPAVLARIGSLELTARVIVEGFLQGLHRSPFRGSSVEFAEYRQYMPGDDPARIDWKVLARSDRYFVKKFEQETNQPCHLLLDASASMDFGSTGITKLRYGTWLTAALAFLLNRQRDAVGLTVFDDEVRASVAPGLRPGHVRHLLAALDRTRPGLRSNLARPLNRLAETMTRRGLVVLVSDLLDEVEPTVQALRHLRFKGMEVIVFQLIDPAERELPYTRSARFVDPESAGAVVTSPAAVRGAYLAKFEAFLARYRDELAGAGVEHVLVDTGRPFEWPLMEYLAARRRRL
ncbi:MAG: DUF58 domain-containing protein [Vicinamibacteraceae bacterium]|nr:DUF58 domain-containing protein [Vicinamibacteraceae bacterium]